MNANPPGPWLTYLLVSAGIVISIVLPWLRAKLPIPQFVFGTGKKYLYFAAFSLLTAVLVVAFNDGRFASPYAALIAGYAWDSTLQKLAKG